MTPTAAHAEVIGYSETGVSLIEAPPDVTLNKLESANRAFVFNERQAVYLTSDVRTDAAGSTTPTTYKRATELGERKVSEGLFVDSHLLHVDPVKKKTLISGSVTFSGQILGVIATPAKLAESDFLGAPGTAYAGGLAVRGLDLKPSAKGTRFTVTGSKLDFQFSTAPKNLDEVRILTARANPLDVQVIGISESGAQLASFDQTVTYYVTVKNTGPSDVDNVRLANFLPPEAPTLQEFVAAPPEACPDASLIYLTFNCELGSLAPSGQRTIAYQVRAPDYVPEKGSLLLQASAYPGPTTVVNNLVQVAAEGAGVSGDVPAGGSISTGGDNPATVTLPDGGSGAPVVITQGPGDFCFGPCDNITTTVSDIPGYTDPSSPIVLTLEYNFADFGSAIDAATATFIKFNPLTGASSEMIRCVLPGYALPSPCIDGISGDYVFGTPNPYQITVRVLMLSWDPRIGYRKKPKL